jgi:glutathione peroxidase
MHARRCSVRRAWIAGATLLTLAFVSEAQQPAPSPGRKETPLAQDSFYRLTVKTLEGQPADLTTYAGQVALVVNVASQCGFTPQYTGLEKLYDELKGRGFVVLGFPSNDFGGQEPGTAEEIATFCKTKYDVSFPLFEKGVTKAGPTQSPVYQFLGATGNLPGWNFSKYVIDKKGQVVAFFPSKVTPDAPELKAAIDKALAE